LEIKREEKKGKTRKDGKYIYFIDIKKEKKIGKM
jgi:hypothetical protein